MINFIKGNGHEHSSSSFLFSSRNKDGLASFTANLKQGQEQHATYCYTSYVRCFGAGSDLCICDNPHQVCQAYSNFGYSYQLPTGYVYGSGKAKKLLAGQYQFLTTEIEVFN